MNNSELAMLIQDVAAKVDKGNAGTVADAVKPLRAVVVPGCWEGRCADMDHTIAGYRMQLEWYAGQLLAMIDGNQLWCINSWLNCVNKFTTPRQP